MERRYLTSELRLKSENDNEPTKIVGYAAVFDAISEDLGGFIEQIAPGAFVNALATSDVRALVNHDSNLILGRNVAGTLALTEDEMGLRYEIDPPATQYANDLMESLRRGDVDQSSFGFTVKRDEWIQPDSERDLPMRIIHEIEQLYDVSPVTFPAYRDTVVSARCIEQAEALRQVTQQPNGRQRRRVDLLRRKLKLRYLRSLK